MRLDLSAGSFHYTDSTSGDEMVVLLHALGRSAADWDPIIQRLSHRYRLMALDARGHGESCRPGDYSFELMRDDVRDFVDALGLARFHLIGHSMGATVAILFSQRWPERIDHLVLEDTPPPSGRERVPAAGPAPPEPVPFDWQLVAPIVRQLNNPDPAWWSDLSTITAPTLVIGGGADSFIDQSELAETAGLIRDARLITIEAGHHVHSTRPDEFAAAVEGFLSD